MGKLHLIVEGEGDREAVPVLIRKILSAKKLHHIQLTSPQISGDVGKAFKRLSDFLVYGYKNGCPILWILDCDDKNNGKPGCPVNHVKNLQAEINKLKIHTPYPVEFSFFVKEFESLYLAERKALIDYYNLPNNIYIDPGASLRRDAKGEISKLLGKDKGYKETTDQAKIAARLDLDECRRVSRDYQHLESAVLRLCSVV